jgi:hypothetical protein
VHNRAVRYFAMLLLCACSPAETPEDVGTADSGELVRDAGITPDSGAADSGAPADSGPADAGSAGFGIIAGSCGELDDELTSAAPASFFNRIDFGDDGYDDADEPRLTEGGREIIRDGNAGGSSLFSEIFAYEVLNRCEGALLLKTETEVEYLDPMSKLTDLLVEIDGMKVGVSVTRAVGFPRDAPYTEAQAQMLLEDKLSDILISSANVAPGDRWVKQILHVIAYGPMHAESMLGAFEVIDAAIKSDTILIVTESQGMDEFLY